ncbi:protein TonB [Raoultella sp. BIGb0138]|uniref:cell envelope integrity protein TolA n=1 Tax=Raoultella sp. BIGb0138 TaxID=2485115 RepID=UPI0010D28DF5|nr:energy transducer TonB [Raoultella sp. BIGb0138]TCW09977.1 protein TonB [Raoultella sp. BIGb0138]
MNGNTIAPFTPPRSPWLGGSAASVLFHAALILPFIIHFSLRPAESPPAAVMMEYAAELEVSFIRPELSPGVSQQRKVEQMTEQETAHDKALPKLLAHPDAELKLAASRPERQNKKAAELRKKSHREQRAEPGNATTTSMAAPPVQPALTQRNAAPLDTDASRISESKISWQSLVKGKINKMRNYPDDARRRQRSGTAKITFRVNERGELLSSQLVVSSGTLSLDRAALTALQNARPLPPPPKEILKNGIHQVTLPIEFDLLNR